MGMGLKYEYLVIKPVKVQMYPFRLTYHSVIQSFYLQLTHHIALKVRVCKP